MSFNYIVVNQNKPYQMTKNFQEGTKVNVNKVVGNGLVMITNGQDLQVCHIVQLKAI